MASLSLFLLGSIAVQRDGERIDMRAHDRLQALLAYLAVERRHAHGRQSLATLLWPETEEAHSRANLRQLVHRLRVIIGDTDSAQPILLLSPDCVQLHPDANIWIDVEKFETLIAQCSAPFPTATAESAERLARMRQAVALYSGEFLSGLQLPDSELYQEWVTLKQAELHNQALAALSSLAEWHEQQGDHAAAARYVEQQLKLEPWCEDAHRLRMGILAAQGKRTAALQQYVECRRVLAAEFGVAPTEETERLYQAIRHDLPPDGRDGACAQTPPQEMRMGGKLAAAAARPASLFLAAHQAIAQGNYLLAANQCEQLTVAAQRTCDADMLWLAEGLFGTNELFHGDLQRACHHLENVCDAGMQERTHFLRRLTGADFLAVSLNWLQWALHARGCAKAAQKRGAAALLQAGNHRPSLDFLIHWRKLMLSWASVQPNEATAQGAGCSEPASTGEIHGSEQLLELLGQVKLYAATNQTSPALLLISRALQWQETSGLNLFTAEFYRLRAELLLELAAAQVVQAGVRHSLEQDAESSLRIAIELAHIQQIPLWELRSTITLSRLFESYGRDAEAVALLTALYSRFSKEFDLPELGDAQSLLQAMRARRYA